MGIQNPEDIQVGRIVHLYPQSKMASENVHRQLTVTVLKDPLAHWPMVVVGWKEDNSDRWELVHRDNIRLRRATGVSSKQEKAEGDTNQGTSESRWARVRKMPGRPVEVELPDDMEQGSLF